MRVLISIITIVIFTINTFASDQDDAKLLLIKKITNALVGENVKVFIIDKNYQNLNSSIQTNDCNKADIIISENFNKIYPECNNTDEKMIILTNYKEYKKSCCAIGTLFWQKGRPNLIFSKNKLKEDKINLPKEFDKYIE